MTSRSNADWERIEQDYRAGVLSIAEMAREHGITRAAIQKRAKAGGWVRDLTTQVQREAATRLVAPEVAPANAREIVERAAEQVVALVRQHRTALASDNARVNRLAEKLDGMLDSVADLEDLNTAQGIAESIARTRHKLIALERQAFNVDGQGHGAVQNPLANKAEEDLERVIAIRRARAEGRTG